VKIPLQVTDSFVSDNIYYCHGWLFDLQQMFGHWLYGWLVNQFPYLYQKFIKTPFELKIEDKNYLLRVEKIHEKAKEFINSRIGLPEMGHTHEPVGNDGKLFDCGT
jgi:hypothetical protein